MKAPNLTKKNKKPVVQEPLPEGKATAEIVLRDINGIFGRRYEFFAQVVSARGFEERHLVKYSHGTGFEKAIYADVIEEGGTLKRAYHNQVRKDVQEKALNKITQALMAEGFSPTHARGPHWFSIRFEKN